MIMFIHLSSWVPLVLCDPIKQGRRGGVFSFCNFNDYGIPFPIQVDVPKGRIVANELFCHWIL